jgi:hypothetical protein
MTERKRIAQSTTADWFRMKRSPPDLIDSHGFGSMSLRFGPAGMNHDARIGILLSPDCCLDCHGRYYTTPESRSSSPVKNA